MVFFAMDYFPYVGTLQNYYTFGTKNPGGGDEIVKRYITWELFMMGYLEKKDVWSRRTDVENTNGVRPAN